MLQAELEQIQRQNEEENEKWLRSELLLDRQWRAHQKRLEEQQKAKDLERKRIQDEFKAEQDRLVQLAEKKAREREESEKYQAEFLLRIDAYISGESALPDELSEMAETNPGKPICQFFAKIGNCRFGNKCSRNHSRPKIGRTLLIPSFFTDIRLNQGAATEYGSDQPLEYDDSELYRAYDEFFDDVTPEFCQFGSVKQFVACQNYEPHLRGNVYIEYENQR